MSKQRRESFVYATDQWEFDPRGQSVTLKSTGEATNLGPQCSAVLELLCRNHGETVSRQRFIEEIWDGNHLVGDHGLRQDVWRIRKALGTEPEHPQLVTIPRAGYRLDASGFTRTPRSLGRMARLNKRGRAIALLLVAAILAPVVFHLVGKPPSPSARMSPFAGEPLNHFDGLAESPELTPDGQKLVYAARDDSGAWSIRVEQLPEAALLKEIVHDDDRKLLEPVFSPDGTRVAFLKRLSSYENLLEYSIIIHDLASGTEHAVGRATGVQTIQPGLDWSDDGRFLLFPQAERVGELPVRIVRLDLKTSDVTALTEASLVDIGPRFMPDSLDFSFVRLPDPSGADLFAWIGSEIHQLTREHAFIHSHDWIDGQTFVLSMFRENAYRAFVGRRDSTELERLGSDPGFRSPVVVEDNLYWIRSGYSVGTRLVSLEGEHEQWTLEPVGRVLKDAAIHPWKPLLAFSDDRSGHEEIWLSDLRGRGARQLTGSRARLIQPIWSRDGEMLAARLDDPAQGTSRPVRIDLTSGRLIEIAPAGLGIVGFLFSGDPRFGIAVRPGAGESEIWRLSLDESADATVIFEGPVDKLEAPGEGLIAFESEGRPIVLDVALGVEVDPAALVDRPGSESERWVWRSDREKMRLLDRADPDSVREIVAVDISATPGYWFTIEPGQKLAAWSEYLRQDKRIYRASIGP